MSIALGSIQEGIVTGITNFGAFVKLDAETTGLVHISEIADTYVKEISDFIKIGDKVSVKVVNISDNGKIGLSIKQAQTKPEPEAERDEIECDYVANKNTKKFHIPTCSSVEDMKPENRWDFTGTREEVIAMGYVPCKRCNP